jgi:hypothetical protein
MTLGLLIAASDLVVNLLGLLLDRLERLCRRRAPTAAPIYVIHNHYVVHNHYEANRFAFTASTGTNTPIRRVASAEPPATRFARDC